MSNVSIKPYEGPMDRTFKKFAQVKYPSLDQGSEEFKNLRHSFFVGVWAMMGEAQRMNNLNARRGKEYFDEIYAETKSALDPLNHHNIHGIIVPRPPGT